MYLQNKKPCSCLRKQEQVEHQKFIFSWDIIFMSMSDWLCLNTLKAQHRVQWVATPTVLVYPLQLASRGWSGPAILLTWDWTNNRKVVSPTPTPTKPRWLWQLRLTQSIYNPNGAQLLRSVHYVVPASKVKKIKIKFHAMLWCDCCDVML